MSIKWKTGFTPSVVVEKLSEIRTLDGDKVSFSGFEYHEYISLLKSMIHLDETTSTIVSEQLVVNGFHEAAKKKNLTPDGILSAIKKQARQHQSKPEQHFWLLTSLNLTNIQDIPKYRINGCEVRFYNQLPLKYKIARDQIISDTSSWLTGSGENYSCYVTVHTKDKGALDAAEKMLDALNLLRGIWNLHLNKTMVMHFGHSVKPINQITPGALHTLHDKNGNSSGNTFWYEPDYHKGQGKVNFSKKSDKTLKFTKDVRESLKKNKYGRSVETALIRYAESLDLQNHNTAFIKLWSLLEYLTSTLKDSYDKTIKRTVFQYKDREYNRQVLEHLRQYRNKSVHLGSSENNIETHVYQLKGYVEQLLHFHIVNHFTFESLQEAATFMDLHPDIDLLKKQVALRKAGIKFLGG